MERSTRQLPDYAEQVLVFDCEQGEPFQVEKIVAVFTSRDWAISSPENEAKRAVERAGDDATTAPATLRRFNERLAALARELPAEDDATVDDLLGSLLRC